MSTPFESIATLPPFGPIDISSQWESQKNRFALISFGKIQFLSPCIWDLPFMSYRVRGFGSVRDCAANKFLIESSLHSFSRIFCEGSRTCRDSNDQKWTVCGNDSITVRYLRGTVSQKGFLELHELKGAQVWDFDLLDSYGFYIMKSL